jgi:hypothetical protein
MMEKRTVCTAVAATLCLLARNGAAQEVIVADSLAHELVETMIPRSQMDRMLDGMMMMTEQMLSEQISSILEHEETEPTSEAAIAACMRQYQERLVQDMRSFFLEEMDLVGLTRSVYERIYADHFSEQELRDLLAFYQSTTGQKYVERQSDLALEAMQAINAKMTPAMMRMMKPESDSLLSMLRECLRHK